MCSGMWLAQGVVNIRNMLAQSSDIHKKGKCSEDLTQALTSPSIQKQG